MESFHWQHHEKELDKILFSDFPYVKKGSEDHKNFWKFFERYQRFNTRHSKSNESSSSSSSCTTVGGDDDRDNSSFSFPSSYDKSYRISFSVMTEDMAYRLRQIQQRREDDGRRRSPLTMQHLTYIRTALRHYVNFLQKKKFDKLVKIREDQMGLPIYQFKEHILSAVNGHQVVLIAGDTGCGKSTQVPRYLLSAGYSQIACTQPRRIACLFLAKRVSSVLNKDTKQFGKNFMFYGHPETCWNSDEGSPQYISVSFPWSVVVSEVRIRFQGGFASRDCSLMCSVNDGLSYEEIIKFYPEDSSSLQCFPVPSTLPTDIRSSIQSSYKDVKIVFNTSTDFYGRIIVYSLDIWGNKL